MNDRLSGFREQAHTADWAINIWAPNLEGLFAEAARGMYSLMGVKIRKTHLQQRLLQLTADDAEILLVSFLSELLFMLEQEQLASASMRLQLEGLSLEAVLELGSVEEHAKEIKAVTYHNLAILREDDLYRVTVVFDV